MKFYDVTKALYIDTDAPEVGLGAALLQTRRPTAFASKSITGTEKGYSSIEREALGILYRLQKFHHYCFMTEVSIITDHKSLVATLKDIATLSKRMNSI